MNRGLLARQLFMPAFIYSKIIYINISNISVRKLVKIQEIFYWLFVCILLFWFLLEGQTFPPLHFPVSAVSVFLFKHPPPKKKEEKNSPMGAVVRALPSYSRFSFSKNKIENLEYSRFSLWSKSGVTKIWANIKNIQFDWLKIFIFRRQNWKSGVLQIFIFIKILSDQNFRKTHKLFNFTFQIFLFQRQNY